MQVYRICWCKDTTNYDKIDTVDAKHCWWTHQDKIKDLNTEAQKCLETAREWYLPGSLQALGMVQW